jgi:hypothetical protein
MKYIAVFATCLLSLMFSAGQSIAVVRMNFSETGLVLVFTGGKFQMRGSLQLKNLLDSTSGVRSTNGEMRLLLSPNEYIEFQHGEITRYFCCVEFDKKCRAVVSGRDGDPPGVMAMGGMTDDGARQYGAKFILYDKDAWGKFGDTRVLMPPYTLTAIDGINVNLSYKNGKYVISTR